MSLSGSVHGEKLSALLCSTGTGEGVGVVQTGSWSTWIVAVIVPDGSPEESKTW